MIDKRKLVRQIQQHLEAEFAELGKIVKTAHEAAVHEQNKPEDEADSRSAEAAQLANAQSERLEEIRRTLLMYRFLPMRDYGPDDVIVPSALVELEISGKRAFYFIVPSGGGLVTNVDGQPVQVITPRSPIGEALLGKRTGDLVEVETRGSTREYKVISVR